VPNRRIIIPTILLLLLASGAFHPAHAGPVEVQSIQMPLETKVGLYPDITGSIKVNKVSARADPGNDVIAVVLRPDHVMKSWYGKM
jgi:hypothetical protein